MKPEQLDEHEAEKNVVGLVSRWNERYSKLGSNLEIPLSKAINQMKYYRDIGSKLQSNNHDILEIEQVYEFKNPGTIKDQTYESTGIIVIDKDEDLDNMFKTTKAIYQPEIFAPGIINQSIPEKRDDHIYVPSRERLKGTEINPGNLIIQANKGKSLYKKIEEGRSYKFQELLPKSEATKIL